MPTLDNFQQLDIWKYWNFTLWSKLSRLFECRIIFYFLISQLLSHENKILQLKLDLGVSRSNIFDLWTAAKIRIY